ncbi:MAG: hypothetical protein IJ079_03170 [Lachnospiraceae bacterium]|nr:hypothetical protein [Lachnospiraceae bacterium]
MKTLITIRDTIKEFLSKFDRFVIPVVKFVVVLLVLGSFNKVMGYSDDMASGGLMFVISLVSAFLPIQLIVLIAGAVGFMHMYAVSLDVAAVYLVMFILMYLLYLRFAPKYGWLVIIMPMFYLVKLHYIVPIIVGIFVGPVGIVPAAFGVIFYYFTKQVADYKTLMQMASEENSLQGFTYIIKGLMESKEMLLTIVVFAFVIAATYIIYRQNFKYSWIVAIGSGGILSIVLFLMGGIVLEADTNTGAIFLGTIVGVLIAVVAQFFKGILDYSRVENVQFEDDEYYYYVKAIPKIRMEKQNIRVKKITDTDEEIDEFLNEGSSKKTPQVKVIREGVQQSGTSGTGKLMGRSDSRTTNPASGRRNDSAQRSQSSAQTRTQTGSRGTSQARTQTTPQGTSQTRIQNPIPQRTQGVNSGNPVRPQSGAQSNYSNTQRQAQRRVYDNTRNQAQRTNNRYRNNPNAGNQNSNPSSGNNNHNGES